METIKKVFKTGHGPSSSHTMGPGFAAKKFASLHPNAQAFKVTLFGSLASTGKGHLTDIAISKTLAPKPVEIIWKPETHLSFHPNGMEFIAIYNNEETKPWRVFSIGGGDILEENEKREHIPIYPHNTMNQILHHLQNEGMTFWEYIQSVEGNSIWEHLSQVWVDMQQSVEKGLKTEGTLPGGLNLPRKATSYYIKAQGYKNSLKRRSLLFAYALAVAEENASGGKVVTAPTCGSAGVVPAVLYSAKKNYKFTDDRILHALATAGLIGNLVKKNASVSGAEVGCQGEVGTACAMAAAAITQLFGGTPVQIEYAAEMGLEHHLGLTCDPVAGLVQVPCIERNAFAAARAYDANSFAMLSDGHHRISFDKVVHTMKQTGHDLPSLYRETSEGGLAKFAVNQSKK